MEPSDLRKSVVWGVTAFFITEVHPVSVMAGLIITVIASVIGALN
jgi:hypothetical protein